jgi:hypothetical protein
MAAMPRRGALPRASAVVALALCIASCGGAGAGKPAEVSLTLQWEAVFIAIAGIVFGVASGLVLGLGIAQAASVHGFTRLAIPARRAVGLSEAASVARLS